MIRDDSFDKVMLDQMMSEEEQIAWVLFGGTFVGVSENTYLLVGRNAIEMIKKVVRNDRRTVDDFQSRMDAARATMLNEDAFPIDLSPALREGEP